MKLILLNGPSQCGKDTAAQVILNRCTRKAIHTKLAVDLKVRCHAAYGLWSQGGSLPHDFFEKKKDEPMDCFEGLSPRDAYIKFMDNWIVPTFGDGMLATWLIRRLNRVKQIEAKEGDAELTPTAFAVISDVRRRADIMPLKAEFGASALILVRLHRDGREWGADAVGSGYQDVEADEISSVDVKNPESILDGLFINLRDAMPEVFAPRLLGPTGEKL